MEIITNGQVNRYTTDNVFPFFTIGHFTAGETVKVRIAFPENSTVTFQTPEFFALNLKPTRKPLKGCTNKKFMCKPKEIPLLQIFQQTTIQVSFSPFLMIKGGQRRSIINLSLFEGLKKDLWLLMSLKEKDKLFYISFHMG